MTCASALLTLGLVFSKSPAPVDAPVSVQFALDGDTLKVHYEVKESAVYGRGTLNPGQYSFNYDVVELFLSVAGQKGNVPYYEFDVDAAGQIFQLKIQDPHHIPPRPTATYGLQAVSTPTDDGWTADLEIPLKALGWKGDPKTVIANAFAVLGEPSSRAYWSAFLPRSQHLITFHQPVYFQPALTCE